MNTSNNSSLSSIDNETITRPLNNRNTLTFAEAWDEVFERTLSKDKLYSEVRAGRVPHIRVGSKILFRRNALEAWFHEQETINCSGKDLT
ncbi:helix-turn-helix domain-containing protein [Paenibacillus ihuae]|uniref:helix-turn-helix domain-containing protein n=1 Tax=Paenibacillus ihuae TaxID=1232431 RepID=UPI000A53AAC4|nr:helix-turn-helix domain-containing protein [Paenibacillus ihuae]